MGTRNLTMVIEQEKPKVAQYGQWDGYPEGQGLTVLEFLHNCDLNVFREKLQKLRFVSGEEIKKIYEDAGAEPDSEWITMEVANKVKSQYPALSRDTAADVLQMIYDGEVTELKDSREFIADSLFCEWAYVIDLDKNTFEVYQGFNTQPLNESDRFYSYTPYCSGEEYADKKEGTYTYHPVRLTKQYSLDDLPTVEQFIKDFTNEEDI